MASGSFWCTQHQYPTFTFYALWFRRQSFIHMLSFFTNIYIGIGIISSYIESLLYFHIPLLSFCFHLYHNIFKIHIGCRFFLYPISSFHLSNLYSYFIIRLISIYLNERLAFLTHYTHISNVVRLHTRNTWLFLASNMKTLVFFSITPPSFYEI